VEFWNVEWCSRRFLRCPQTLAQPKKYQYAGVMTKETYVSDAPVTDSKNDRFRRWPFAKRVAETIASRTDPSSLVAAIYGAWGDGKTSVLNFISQELATRADILTVKFNPWRFGDESAVLRHFFAELARVVGASLTSKSEDFGAALEKYGKFLDFAWSGAGKAASTAGSLMSAVDLEEQKRRVAEILKQHGKRIVVLMDDIDRLEKNEVQSLFRLLKLSADFDYTAYVLAFDAEMVASAIGERFTGEESRRAHAGRSFLEKIVQVPLSLPAIPTEELRRYCLEAVSEALDLAEIQLDDAEVRRFVFEFDAGVQIRLKTPRMAKRYGNALTFALAINKGEVNPVDMMLIEAIRIFYPDAFETIRHNKDVFLGDKTHGDKELSKRAEATMSLAARGLNAEEAHALRKMLDHLFPAAGEHRYSINTDHLAEHQRVASERYFDRYFSYSVPAADISDRAITQFIKSSETLTIDRCADSLRELVSPLKAGAVVAKLRAAAKTLPPVPAERIALAVSLVATFPDTPSIFFDQPFDQAALLVYNLLERIEKPARLKAASEVLAKAMPINFAMQALKWFHSSEETPEPERLFTQDEIEHLQHGFAARIKDYFHANTSEALASGEQQTASLLLVWTSHGIPGEAQAFVKDALVKQKELAIPLLKAFAPISFSTAGVTVGPFERRNYESLLTVVPGDVIDEVLRTSFGDDLDHSSYPRERSVPEDRRIANQFAYIHAKVQEERKPQDQSPPERKD